MWLGMMPVMAYDELPCAQEDLGKVVATTSRSAWEGTQIFYLSSDESKPTMFLESPSYFLTCLYKEAKDGSMKYLLDADNDELTTFQIKDEDGNFYGNHMMQNSSFDCK